MKIRTFIFLLLFSGLSAGAQITPDLSKVNNNTQWEIFNRDIHFQDGIVHMNAMEGNALLWLKEFNFENGTIELDIKGKDLRGQSFVGLAFHGQDNETYDAIYFRPFNFQSPERKGHSVQYISHPKYTWNSLRQEYPEKYENPVIPVPNPNEWFHAKIVVKYPLVKVFVNDSKEASLIINQLSSIKKGWIGFWVGNGSDGYFKNLKIVLD